MTRNGDQFKCRPETVDAHERGRKDLTPLEMDRLIKAAKGSRNSERGQAPIMLLYRHA